MLTVLIITERYTRELVSLSGVFPRAAVLRRKTWTVERTTLHSCTPFTLSWSIDNNLYSTDAAIIIRKKHKKGLLLLLLLLLQPKQPTLPPTPSVIVHCCLTSISNHDLCRSVLNWDRT